MTKQSSALARCTLVAAFALAGCQDSFNETLTTPPFEGPLVETPPAPDPEPGDEAVFDEVVFDSTAQCLDGNWSANNEAYGNFFAQTDDDIIAVSVDGLATMTIDEDTFRVFFNEWDIRYDTGEPSFLITRNGNETVQFFLTDEDVLEVVERENAISLQMFSLIGGDGEALEMATDEADSLPMDGATVVCAASALEVYVDGQPFIFDRL